MKTSTVTPGASGGSVPISGDRYSGDFAKIAQEVLSNLSNLAQFGARLSIS